MPILSCAIIACDDSCHTCEGPGNSACTSCPGGTALTSTGMCVVNCGESMFASEENICAGVFVQVYFTVRGGKLFTGSFVLQIVTVHVRIVLVVLIVTACHVYHLMY